jgi:hypothetical protein
MIGYKPPSRKAPAQLSNASGYFLKDSLKDNGKDGISATLRTITGDVTITSTQPHRRGEFERSVQAGVRISAFGEMESDRKAMTLTSMTAQDPLAAIRETPFEDVAQKVEVDRRLLVSFSGKLLENSFNFDRQGRSSATLITPAGPLDIQTMDNGIGEKLEAAVSSGEMVSISGSLTESRGRIGLHMHKVEASPEIVVDDPFAAAAPEADVSREMEMSL